jgi:hypothetical protein
MVKSVVRGHHWEPSEFENLYLDDADFFGLEFWHNDVNTEIKSLNNK